MKQMNRTQMKNFKAEVNLMVGLRPHLNIVQFIGVCNNPEKPLCLITGILIGLFDDQNTLQEEAFTLISEVTAIFHQPLC